MSHPQPHGHHTSQAPSVLCALLIRSCEQVTAAGRPTRAAAKGRHQQRLNDSDADAADSDDSASDEEDANDSDGSDGYAAAAAAGEDGEATTGGRSARAGRSLRNTIKKPPPSVRTAAAEAVCWALLPDVCM
jgi:hypothetical protein